MPKPKKEKEQPEKKGEITKSVPVIINGKRQDFDIKMPPVALVTMRIEGLDELIVNNGMNAVTQMEIQRLPPELRPTLSTPEEQFEASKYIGADDKECILGEAFVKSICAATVEMDKRVSRASFQRAIQSVRQLIPLDFKECYMRRDRVIQGAGPRSTASVRYRAAYRGWSCVVQMRLVINTVRIETFITAMGIAGTQVGVGDWRPGAPKGGPHGKFKVTEYKVDIIGMDDLVEGEAA